MARNADTHIRITEDVWQELNSRKEPGDSFNDVIERQIQELEGLRSDIKKAKQQLEELDED